MTQLIELFFSFFQVGLISFGGGYASLTPIYNQVVLKHSWLSAEQFTDLITISQMTFGPIAINAATFVGLRIAGIPGAITATLGSITPSLIIAFVFGYLFFRFSKLKIMRHILGNLRPTIIALIAIAALSLFQTAIFPHNINYLNIIIFIVSLFLLNRLKMDPIKVMVLMGMVGAIVHFL